MINLRRRTLVQAMISMGAVAATPLRGLAMTSDRPLPIGKQAATFIQHNSLPWALETNRASFGFGPLTPVSRFFVRNNLPMPGPEIIEDRDAWRFDIEGTKTSGSLSLAELKTMPVTTVASVLQCSGNGRAFFPHKPSGSPWSVGAAGCALWTGVAVKDVLAHFGGPLQELEFLTTTGGETLPEGIDKDAVAVERSIPLAKGLEDCLLVWEMNGAPLPLAHGGPLRLIVPGYFGVNNVKWVKRLAVTAGESAAKIQQSGYRNRPIGEKGGPAHPSMWRMPVKSWLNGPGAQGAPVLAGPNVLYGVAFSGERGISKVEISGDDGKSWQQAEFVGPDLGANAWRAFKLHVDLPTGEHVYASRATDTAGEVQPQLREENERGYGNNSWSDHALAINAVDVLPEHTPGESHAQVASQPQAAAAADSKPLALSDLARRGKEVFLGKAQPACGVCHTLADAGTSGVVGPNLNSLDLSQEQVGQAVRQGVGVMPAFGAQLGEDEIAALARYVFEATR